MILTFESVDEMIEILKCDHESSLAVPSTVMHILKYFAKPNLKFYLNSDYECAEKDSIVATVVR